MHSAATWGPTDRWVLGASPLRRAAGSCPGESWPSSVVRSQQRSARSRAHSLESFFIERVRQGAARSFAPTCVYGAADAVDEIERVRGRSSPSASVLMLVLVRMPVRVLVPRWAVIAISGSEMRFGGPRLRREQVDELLGGAVESLSDLTVGGLQHDRRADVREARGASGRSGSRPGAEPRACRPALRPRPLPKMS